MLTHDCVSYHELCDTVSKEQMVLHAVSLKPRDTTKEAVPIPFRSYPSAPKLLHNKLIHCADWTRSLDELASSGAKASRVPCQIDTFSGISHTNLFTYTAKPIIWLFLERGTI